MKMTFNNLRILCMKATTYSKKTGLFQSLKKNPNLEKVIVKKRTTFYLKLKLKKKLKLAKELRDKNFRI